MSAEDFVLQMPPQGPRSQLEVIAGETDPQTAPRRGGIIRLTVDVPSARRAPGEPRPSRWRTPEFFLYYAIFVTAVPWMIYVPVKLSSSAYYFCRVSASMSALFDPTFFFSFLRDTPELRLVSP
jgi:hypothetical protein